MPKLRIGQGSDLHRLVPGKPLLIGGVSIESPVGSEAHSDGDVVLHSLIDALLGAAGLGDIGDHFPPTDPQYKNANSQDLLKAILPLIANKGLEVVNVDSTVFLEAPKLGTYKLAIRQQIASLLRLSVEDVSLKAKTAEGLGAIGTQQAVAASVVVLLQSTKLA